MPEVTHDWDDENYTETLNTAFAEYRNACYGSATLNEVQEREVKQAFFSGVHWLNSCESYCPDDLNQALHAVCKPFFGTTNCDATEH
jgi:hypothetical protein